MMTNIRKSQLEKQIATLADDRQTDSTSVRQNQTATVGASHRGRHLVCPTAKQSSMYIWGQQLWAETNSQTLKGKENKTIKKKQQQPLINTWGETIPYQSYPLLLCNTASPGPGPSPGKRLACYSLMNGLNLTRQWDMRVIFSCNVVISPLVSTNC